MEEKQKSFSKGVAFLGWLRNVRALKELDVSRNRQIDDYALHALHTALSIAK